MLSVIVVACLQIIVRIIDENESIFILYVEIILFHVKLFASFSFSVQNWS